MLPFWWRSETQEFFIKAVDEGQVTTLNTKLTFRALALHQSKSRQAYERRKSHLFYLLTVLPPLEFDLFMFPHHPPNC